MSKTMFAAKLASSTRKAKEMTKKPARPAVSASKTKRVVAESKVASTSKAKKITSKAAPKQPKALTELVHQKDLLNPADLELFWKRKNLVRIWPD